MCFPYFIKFYFVAKTWARSVDYILLFTVFICLASVVVCFAEVESNELHLLALL